jgi:Major Facilitator Superfamily
METNAEIARRTELLPDHVKPETLATLTHEIPTSMLPALVTGVLTASPAALAAIEGVANACGIVARALGAALTRDGGGRRRGRLSAYSAVAVLSSVTGLAGTAVVAGILRAGAWSARGIASPVRHVQVAARTHRSSLGRAYARERIVEHAAGVAGPVVGCLLLFFVGVRTAIVIAIVPGILAFLFALKTWGRKPPEAPAAAATVSMPVSRMRELVTGQLGWGLVGIAAFEFGNITVVLLILRATSLFKPDHGLTGAAQLAALGYAVYQLAATIGSWAAGRVADRVGAAPPLAAGSAFLLGSYVGFAVVPDDIPGLAACFAGAGAAIGLVEPSEHTLMALHAPAEHRERLFRLLAVIDGAGILVASVTAGILWTLVTPAAGLLWSGPALLLCIAALARAHTR